MSAYLLANITVNNPENYKEYVEKVKSIVEKFDGEYLVRGGEMSVIEGDWPHKRNIVIKFPSREKAMEWYKFYNCRWSLNKIILQKLRRLKCQY